MKMWNVELKESNEAESYKTVFVLLFISGVQFHSGRAMAEQSPTWSPSYMLERKYISKCAKLGPRSHMARL